MRSFFLFLFAFAASLSAQEVDLSLFKDMSLRHIGPAGMSGRVTSIDVVRENKEEIVIGTASGGLWKTANGGMTWDPLFDEQPISSIGAVAIQPNNADVIWAGTGEGNPRNSASSGAGIYKSIDGGKTWALMGLKESKTIHRIIIHRDNPNIVFVGATGSAWGPNEERGVFKTADGGKIWEKVLYINDETGCADLITDPSNPNKIIAAMWEYGRKPWTFNSGGAGSGLHISYDAGETWKKITHKEGLPEGDLGRIGLTISAANPDVIYALVEAKKTGLYKSQDGGENWSLVTTENIGNRPFYYADIYADPKNENHLFNLWSMVSESIDGGKTWKVILPYSGVHPDHHAFYIHPDDPDYMIDGNDGGLNISRDGGESWEFYDNLPLGQFYHINYDMDVPYNIYGGMQDNGSWKGPAYVWHGGGIRNDDWQEFMFGDGFDAVPYAKDSRYVYGMYQGGNVSWIDTETGFSRSVQPNHPEGKELRFNWNGAIAADPHNPDGVYFGSQHLHHSTDKGKSWKILSPDLTTNDSLKQKQAESGGLTIDATRAENFTTLLCIAPSSLDKEVVWVGTDDGHIQLTKNGGETWEKVNPKLKNFPTGAWIPQIIASEHKKGEAFAIVNDYRRNNWKPYLYHTTDFGNTWTSLVTMSDVDNFCLSVVQDPEVPSLLFLGTEVGLYVSFDYGNNWNKWTEDFPSVAVSDLKIHPRENDLIIGTFGRSAYVLDDLSPLREVAKEGLKNTFSEAKLFPVPEAYRTNFMQPRGVRFPADKHFAGENRRSGVRIAYYAPISEIDSLKEEKPKFIVLSEAGDTLRVFEAEADSVLSYTSWWMDTKGTRMPSRGKRDKEEEAMMGGGPRVAPGSYTLIMEYLDVRSEQGIEILEDPRMTFSQSDYASLQERYASWTAIVNDATQAWDALMHNKEDLSRISVMSATLVDSDKDSLTSKVKKLEKQIKQLEEIYMNAADFEGYDHVTERLNSLLWRALEFNGDLGADGSNGRYAMEKARSATDEAVTRIDAFMKEHWEPFVEEVAALNLQPFGSRED